MTQMHVERVRFVGVERLHLDSFTANELERVCARGVTHLRERTGDLIEVTVRVKAHQISGSPERYSVLVEMSYSNGWLSGFSDAPYLMDAVKKAFSKVEHQLEQSSFLD